MNLEEKMKQILLISFIFVVFSNLSAQLLDFSIEALDWDTMDPVGYLDWRWHIGDDWDEGQLDEAGFYEFEHDPGSWPSWYTFVDEDGTYYWFIPPFGYNLSFIEDRWHIHYFKLP